MYCYCWRALSGCTSVMDGVAGTSDLLGKTKARVNQAALDAVGVGALEDAVLASLIYTQVFFAWRLWCRYGDFEEGEGVAWDVTSRDDEGSETIRIERAPAEAQRRRQRLVASSLFGGRRG